MSKFLTATSLFILWVFALLVGLSPMSHHMSFMQNVHMDEMMSHQNDMKHASGEDNSTGSCCDEIASFSIGCAFLVPQSICDVFYGESKRIVNLNPLVQTIYIETALPPPKA